MDIPPFRTSCHCEAVIRLPWKSVCPMQIQRIATIRASVAILCSAFPCYSAAFRCNCIHRLGYAFPMLFIAFP